MKKLVFLLVILLCIISNAKEFTKTEKKEVMKQLIIFQKAIQEKDIETLTDMMSFPLDEHSSLLLGKFTDLTDKTAGGVNPYAVIAEDGISKDLVVKYKENVFKNLETLTLLKVDLNKNVFVSSVKSEVTPADKTKKYYYDENMESYYFYNEKKEKEYKNFCSHKVEGIFTGDILEVKYSVEPDKLTPKSENSCSYFESYYFKLDDNVLKMYKTIAIP